MPKSLNVYSNERIDLPDFELGTRTHAQDLRSHLVESSKIARFSRVLRGFRVEVEDQTANPGQLTVHAGVSFDRSGRVLQIEDQPDASLTTTLSGATQTFYLEVEFSEAPSDLDSRGFWDPSVDNIDPIPDGAEVNVSVSTRLTPTWRIVTPISTTGFTYESAPNSNRVPIAVLSTNASNEIDSSVNLFSTLEYASTTLADDIDALETSLNLVDSQLFPVGAEITIDLGGTSPETARTILSNDIENGIITISPAVVGSHLSGSIIRRTDVGSNTFLPLEENPNSSAYSAGTAATRPNDYQKRMYGSDERRGEALITSERTYGERNDVKLSSEKDFVDSVGAILRELKFGSPRAEIVSSEPPTSFSTAPRYYDRVGSVAGARTHTVSIGDGTTTFGDFNGTDETPFLDAVAFLSITGGSIFIRRGTYTFNSTVTIPASVTINFIGEAGLVELDNAMAGSPALTITGSDTNVLLQGVVTTLSGGYTHFLSSTGTVALAIKDSTILGLSCNILSSLSIESSSIGGTITIASISKSYCINSEFTSVIALSGTLSNANIVSCTIVGMTVGILSSCSVKDCYVDGTIASSSSVLDTSFENCRTSGAVLSSPFLTIGNNIRNLTIRNCSFDVFADSVIDVTGGFDVAYLEVSNCDFVTVDASAQITPAINFNTSEVKNSSFTNTRFFCPVNCLSGPIVGGIAFYDVTDVTVANCYFQTASSINTSAVNVGISISVRDSNTLSIENCTFNQSTTTEYTYGISSSGIADFVVNNCEFTRGYRAVSINNAGSSNDSVSICDCVFYQSAAIPYFAVYSSGSQILDLSVTNSLFTFSGIAGASLAHIGVFFENAASNLVVSGCTFTDFGLNSSSGTYGVFMDTSAANSNISITNNLFTDFIGVDEVAAVKASPTGGIVLIEGNTIKNFDFSGTSVGAISVASVETCTISNNKFSNVLGSDDPSSGTCCIDLAECDSTTIVGNSIIECRDRAVISALYTGAGISTILIDSNTINNTLDTRTSVDVSGILVVTSTSISNCLVSNNIINMTGATTSLAGMDIGNGSGVVSRVVCTGNNVFLNDGDVAIQIDSNYASVTGNAVACNSGGFVSPHSGIILAAAVSGIISGNTLTGSTSAPAAGHYHIDASGNNVGIYSNFAWYVTHGALAIRNTSGGGVIGLASTSNL